MCLFLSIPAFLTGPSPNERPGDANLFGVVGSLLAPEVINLLA